MNSSKPPALATWLLEHLILGDKSEALTGDLLEQFTQGRSAAWYWRQVSVAILLSLSKELRILWLAAPVSILWTFFALYRLSDSIEVRTVSHFLLRAGVVASPYSLIYSLAFIAVDNAFPILFGLGLYLAITRSFSPGRFLRGLFVGLFMVGAIPLLGWALVPTFTHNRYILVSLPLFFALVLSMWNVRPSRTDSRAAKLSA